MSLVSCRRHVAASEDTCGAIIGAREDAVEPDGLRDQLSQLLRVSDLGTAPVVRYREMLRRLIALREEGSFADGSAVAELEVVIAAKNPTVLVHGAGPGRSCLLGSDADTESIRCRRECSLGSR